LVTPPWQAIIAPIERSIDWTINAKMYATESIAVDEIVHEIARDSGKEYHHPWKSDTVP